MMGRLPLPCHHHRALSSTLLDAAFNFVTIW
nr:MAG TPA: hypothetical protein [Caudoviricetes sp.]